MLTATGPFTLAVSVTLVFEEVREPCKKGLNRAHHALQSLLSSTPKGNQPLLKTAGKGSSHLQSRTGFFESVSAFKGPGEAEQHHHHTWQGMGRTGQLVFKS